MATPLTPSQLIAALKAEGVPVREYAGWRDRCRCHNGSHERGENPTGRAWGPIVGTLVHKTAGDLGSRTVEKYILDIIIAATTDVPNKAQFVIAPNGDCWIVSAGRCNHDGQLGKAAHDAYVTASWSLDKAYDPRQGNELVGNTYLYGIENITSTVPNAAQRDTSVRICAAISRAYGWNGRDCAGHGEVGLDRGFTDPQLDMGAFRRDVVARVATGPNLTPPPPQEDDMPLTPEDIQKVADKVWDTFIPAGTSGDTAKSLLGQANQQDWYQTNTLKSLVDTLAKVTADPAVNAANIEKWLKEGIAESVKVSGTLTVSPADSPSA